MKTKVNLSLEPDTADTLKSLAQESHKTVSQWVTDKVWEEQKEKETMDPDLLYNSGFSVRAYRVLSEAGFKRVSEVKKLSYKELKEIKYLGKATLDEVAEKLGIEKE